MNSLGLYGAWGAHYLRLVLLFFWTFPLGTLFAVVCLTQPSVYAAMADGLAFLIDSIARLAGLRIGEVKSLKSLLRDYLAAFPHGRLVEHQFSRVVDGDTARALEGPFQLSGKPAVRIFEIRTPHPPHPQQIKAFLVLSLTSFVFIHDDPAQLTATGKFQLYHELGHISKGSKGATIRLGSALLLTGTTILVALLASDLSYALGVWILLFLGAAFVTDYLDSLVVNEMAADQFAMSHMGAVQPVAVMERVTAVMQRFVTSPVSIRGHPLFRQRRIRALSANLRALTTDGPGAVWHVQLPWFYSGILCMLVALAAIGWSAAPVTRELLAREIAIVVALVIVLFFSMHRCLSLWMKAEQVIQDRLQRRKKQEKRKRR